MRLFAMNVLELPDELFDYIGKYLRDADRCAMARSCQRLRYIFSYVHPSRVLSSGRVLSEEQMDFLEKFSSEVKVLCAPRVPGGDMGDKVEAVRGIRCVLGRKSEPHLMILLLCRLLSPMMLFADAGTLSSLRYTYEAACFNECICLMGADTFIANKIIAQGEIKRRDPHVIVLHDIGKVLKYEDLGEHIQVPYICSVSSAGNRSNGYMLYDIYRAYHFTEINMKRAVYIDIIISDEINPRVGEGTVSISGLYQCSHMVLGTKHPTKLNTKISIVDPFSNSSFVTECAEIYREHCVAARRLYSSFRIFKLLWNFDSSALLEKIYETIHDVILHIFAYYGNIPIIYVPDDIRTRAVPSVCPDFCDGLLKYIGKCNIHNEVRLVEVGKNSRLESSSSEGSDIYTIFSYIRSARNDPEHAFIVIKSYLDSPPVLPPIAAIGCIVILERGTYSRDSILRNIEFANDLGMRIVSGPRLCYVMDLRKMMDALFPHLPHQVSMEKVIGDNLRLIMKEIQLSYE